MSRRSLILATWALALVVAAMLDARGQVVPSRAGREAAAAPLAAPDNSIVLHPFLSGLTSPVFITHAGDGSGRLFVVERGGLIKVVVNGQVLSAPFLNLTSAVLAGGERGLLGLAFHPQYESNGRFFVFYTAAGSGANTLAEFAASPPSSNTANATPRRILFSIPDRFENHNGGMLAFGPDGYLYVGTGDEGSSGDPDDNAQNLASLYGKMLRLDVDSPPAPGLNYAIPPTNPFVVNPNPANARDEIWAVGFRNPWRWSFDRATGHIFVGDVGQGAWEEVDLIPNGQGGLNFGWDFREGAHCFEPPSGCPTTGLTDPIIEYPNVNQPECAVTGGYVYRGTQNPALQGIYFYGDFCSGRIWKGIGSPGGAWTAIEALDTSHSISSFGEDEAGELYVVNLGGTVLRIAQAGPIPTPTQTPTPTRTHTPTPTPTPTPVPCSPRPPVAVQVTPAGAGMLNVVVAVTNTAVLPNNELRSVAFTRTQNARVTIGTQVNQQGGFTVPFPAGTTSARFTVRREQAGVPMHVDLIIADRCGGWPTFVGAGTAVP